MKKWQKPMAVLATSFILGSGLVVTEGILGEPMTVEAASTTYTVTASTLNVRSGSNTKSKVIGSVKKGTKLSVQKKESNGWYKITYNGKTGYVSGSYVKATTSSSSSSSSSSNSSTSSTTYTVTASTLNVRSGSNTKSKVIGSVKKGTKLSVQKKESNGWYKITYNGKTGYVSGSYVKATTSNSSSSNSSSSSSTASSTTYKVTASSLNVRSGAGTKYSTIGSLKKNQSVSVSSISNGWAKIIYNGKTAYVSSSYLSKSSASSNNSSSTSSITDIVNNMKTLGKAEQLVLVTGTSYSTQKATIRTFEKSNGKWKQVHSFSGVVGKKGMTDNMSEGAQAAPTGKYTIGTAFGRGANPGTKLPYRKITSDDVWVDDPNSSLYNTWQKASQNNGRWKSAEKMDIPQYDLGFVINYNTTNTVKGKGSAIFFHVEGSYGYTLGCTATSKVNVTNVLKWLNPNKQPVIIQSPDSQLGKY